MKAIIFKIGRVLLCLILLVISFVQVTYVYRDGLANTRKIISGYYAEQRNTMDVIYIGTSCTFSAIMPMEAYGKYGIASYSFCTNVMLEESMRYAVKEVFKSQSPRLLVIDVAPFLIGSKASNMEPGDYAFRYNTDAYNISIDRNRLIKEIIPEKNKLDYYLDFLFYHTNSPDWSYLNNQKENIDRGYAPLPIKTVYEQTDNSSEKNHVYQFPEEDIRNLNNLIEELNKHECEVLFINSPYYRDDYTRKYDAYVEYIRDYVKQRGFDYYDMNGPEGTSIDSVFGYSLDEMHYNAYSAVEITAALADHICRHYEIPDRREDPDYIQWKEQYDKWQGNLVNYQFDVRKQFKEYFDNVQTMEDMERGLRSKYFTGTVEKQGGVSTLTIVDGIIHERIYSRSFCVGEDGCIYLGRKE